MLTGRVPFDHADPMMQMRMQVKAPPPRLDMLAKSAAVVHAAARRARSTRRSTKDPDAAVPDGAGDDGRARRRVRVARSRAGDSLVALAVALVAGALAQVVELLA